MLSKFTVIFFMTRIVCINLFLLSQRRLDAAGPFTVQLSIFLPTSSLISDSIAGLCDSLELSPLLLQTMNSKTPSTSPCPLLQMWFKVYTSGSIHGEMCSSLPLCVSEPHALYLPSFFSSVVSFGLYPTYILY